MIKLTERISYLREIKDLIKNQEKLIEKKYLNIYIPLKNRFEMEQLKWRLEDYCFRYRRPTEYEKVEKLIHERRMDREDYINNFIKKLHNTMIKVHIQAEIYGRPKHIYSIWQKMKKKSLEFHELFDIRAVRIIVKNLQDCYNALNIVHTYFHYLPNEFDDYISHPKSNGYQSIHTVVLGPNDKILEIQIRTHQMHEYAEFGVAAHWKYKKNENFINKNKITTIVLLDDINLLYIKNKYQFK